MHVLNSWYKSEKGRSIWGKMKPYSKTLLHKIAYKLKPVEKLGAEIITNDLNSIKIAINAKCVTELNNIPAWHTATRVMTPTQKQNVQAEICGCVSEKAPQNVTAVDLATAAIDPAARATIVSNAVSRTINACVAEAVR